MTIDKIRNAYYHIKTYHYHLIKWAWQRVYRGWDDRAVWSIDSHLCNLAYELVDKMSKSKIQGVPSGIYKEEDIEKSEEEWRKILVEIAYYLKYSSSDGDFQYFMDNKIPESEWKNYYKFDRQYKFDSRARKGRKLFVKYFYNLWD
jgi:hypothetical protein